MTYYDLYGGIRADGRRFNGGPRRGAGRPRSKARLMMDASALGKVVVREFRHGQIRWVKKTRLELQLDALFKKGVEGDGNLRALNKYLDLALGKPETPKREKPEKERRDTFILQQQIRHRLATDDYMEATFVVPPPPLPPEKPPLERIRLIVDRWKNEKRLKEKRQWERTERKRLKELEKYDGDFFIDEDGRKVLTPKGAQKGNMIAIEKHWKTRQED